MVAIPGANTLLSCYCNIRYEPELSPELSRAEPIVALTYARCASERRRVYRAESTETLERYRDKLKADLGGQDLYGSRELEEIHDDLQRRMTWDTHPELHFFAVWTPYYPPHYMPRANLTSLQALGNEDLLRVRDREDRLRTRLARRAAKRLRRLVDTEDGRPARGVPDREIGQRWIEESCASDLTLVEAAYRIAYPDQPLVRADNFPED